MPNGDSNYKLGELVGKMNGVEERLDDLTKKIDNLDKKLAFLDKLQGGLNLAKWLISIFGVGTIINSLFIILGYLK